LDLRLVHQILLDSYLGQTLNNLKRLGTSSESSNPEADNNDSDEEVPNHRSKHSDPKERRNLDTIANQD